MNVLSSNHLPAYGTSTINKGDVESGDKSATRGPLTPPHSHMDLPTPPTSSIELSTSTQPPTKDYRAKVEEANLDQLQAGVQSGGEGTTTRTTEDEQAKGADQRPLSAEEMTSETAESNVPERSPSEVAHRRKVNRLSGGSVVPAASNENGHGARPEGEGETDKEVRGRSRERIGANINEAGPSSRSRTPSPILGSVLSSTGRLSFSAALQPSAEEVRSLLYGDHGEGDEETSRPRSVGQDEMDTLMSSLHSMGLANVDADMTTSADGSDGRSRERQLASMVRKLVDHAKKQDVYIDRMEASLHNTRLRSISLLSSVRTSFAHSFATEYELRARLQAELDGAKAQARKLSQLLARSESRNEEVERERAASAEEEIIWQEEMKDHASAYARQQAARARAAHLAQQTPRNGVSDSPKKEQATATTLAGDTLAAGTIASASDETAALPNDNSPPSPAGLDEPFEERKSLAPIGALPTSHSEGSLAGLGILASGGTVQIDAPSGSPLSTVLKERNKLLADKRYLKNRVRDAESQRVRLELELKSLRPLLVRGVPSKTSVSAQLTATPMTPGRAQKRDRSRRRRQAVMGDAEAEHLLLAARRLQSTRKSAADDGRPSTPPPTGQSVTDGGSAIPRTPRTPKTMATPRTAATLDSAVLQSAASTSRMSGLEAQSIAPDASPLAGRAAAAGRWGSHQRVDSARSAGGIDDLLQAAQTVLQPGERQRQARNGRGEPDLFHPPHSYESEADENYEADLTTRRKEHSILAPSLDDSPKRRRVASAAPGHHRRRSLLSMSPEKSAAFAAATPRRTRNHTEGAEPPLSSSRGDDLPAASQASALSALDLLADQAAASQVPSQSSDPSHSGEGEAFMGGGGRSDDSDDGMHVDSMGPNGTPLMGHPHYYPAQQPPRNSFGHVYPGPPPPPPHHHPMGHDPYRMAPGTNPPGAGYGYGPTGGSPVAMTSQGWTSQNVPPGRGPNGIYSPPASQHARFLQSGPRITSGYVANMQDGSRLAKSTHPGPRMMNGVVGMGQMGNVLPGPVPVGAGYDDDDDGGSSGTQRTPHKGGNTSPDKRLPYVRWSEEEDQKLRRAIGEFGQRWESVAGVVGTRTYHQCRQRYLLMRRKEAAAREGGDDKNSPSSPVN